MEPRRFRQCSATPHGVKFKFFLRKTLFGLLKGKVVLVALNLELLSPQKRPCADVRWGQAVGDAAALETVLIVFELKRCKPIFQHSVMTPQAMYTDIT